MIDYEKLKLAHKLIDSLAKAEKESFELRIRFQVYDKSPIYELSDFHERDVLTYLCIDKLIAKLKGLTQPEPKYNIGDTVWFHCGMGDIDFFTIQELDIEELEDGTYSYNDHCEIDLYPSREALIEAQIKYWSELIKPTQVSDNPSNFSSHKKCDCAGCNGLGECNCNKCEHESDGVRYRDPEAMPGQSRLKCIKCGEFYR